MYTDRKLFSPRRCPTERAPRLRFTILITVLVSCYSVSLAVTPEAPDRRQTEILFLAFSDPALPDISAMVEETQGQILEGRDTPIHFSFEFLDPSQAIVGGFEQQRLLSYLRNKYRGHEFKLVIALDERALTLAEECLAKLKLFANAATVFAVVDPVEPRKLSNRRSRRTGVIRNSNFLPTLKLALAQNPGTKRVIVVGGSSEGEALEMSRARAQFRSSESNVEIRYWTDLKFGELGPRLASVGSHTVILFLNFRTDASGEQFDPAQILPAVSSTSPGPIYGTYASFVSKGVVGGSVIDLREVGRMLGQDAVRILNGEKPENIPLAAGEFQRYMFDWRQLQRWGISRDEVPTGSEVLYWEFSPWSLYKWRILSLIAAFAIETLLIILLIQSHADRKQAEQTIGQKQSELSEAQRIAQLGSWQWEPASDVLTCSSTFYTVTGLEASATLSFKALSGLFPPQSWEVWSQGAERCLETGEPYALELEGHRPDGTKVWFLTRAEVVRDESGRVRKLHGTLQDVTQRRLAEEVQATHAAIVESSEDSIVSMDSDGRVVSWNRGAERMFGFVSAEIVGQSILTIVPLELQDDERRILRKIQSGEGIERYESTRKTKEGDFITVSLAVSPVRNGLGRIVGCSEIARDVTDRKRVEEELKKSVEMFSKAFRQSPLAITLTNLKTNKYIDINETYLQLTGYGRDEVIGRTPYDLGLWVNPSERDEVAKRLLTQGSVRDVEYQFKTKGGKVLVGLASAELIEVLGEQCMLAVVADITDRVQAQQALAESERRFRLMADSAPVLMWIAGEDKLCTDFNKEWLRFTGRTLEQELGMGWVQNVHPDDRERCVRAYTTSFEVKRQFTLEFRLRRHDGCYRWIIDRGVPRLLADGRFAGYVGCCIDITDEKEAKAIQRELSGRLFHAQEEERARIARELHDDINQRLALLANGLQQLQHELSKPDETLHSALLPDLRQLTGEIANDIQNLSHQLHPSKLQLLGLPAAVRGLCHEFSKVQKIEVECSVQNSAIDLEETVSLSLYRVIQEALRNVAKHSRAHHVKVELSARANSVHLRISDDGIGFNGHIMDSDHGLGLVSMRERLRLAGGEMSIWSRPSLGTQIEAVVPITTRRARSA
jgi:PAS domain S-box-containing protein